MNKIEKKARYNVSYIIETHLQMLQGAEEMCEHYAGDPFDNREVIRREKELWWDIRNALNEEYRKIIAEE